MIIKNKKQKTPNAKAPEGTKKLSPSAFVVKKRANYKKAISNRKLILSEKLAQSSVADAKQKVDKGQTKKTKLLSLIFMIINIIVVAVIIVLNIKNDSAMPLDEVFGLGIHWWFLIICLLCFVLMSFGETLKFVVLTKSVSGKCQWSISFKTATYGRYYDSITPLSLGGEPYQAYYLTKHGFTAGQSMTITLGKHNVWLITYVFFVTVILILRSVASPLLDQYSVGSTVVSAACWIGYAANAGLMLFMIFMCINRKIGSKLVGGVLKLLCKMKIVKNYDKAYASVMKVVDDFQKGIKYFLKSPVTFTLSILVSLATFVINYCIPFFIFCTFNGFDGGYWFYIMSTCVVIDLAASFIPLPGGTGMAELSFSALFTSLFLDGRLFWAMLLWRLLTYYGYIFQGLFVLLYDYFIGNKKYEWQKRKLSLKSESEEFKKKQLEIYSKQIRPKIK